MARTCRPKRSFRRAPIKPAPLAVLLLALMNFACASKRLGEGAPSTVEILFKGRPGTTSESRYHSNSRTLRYFEGQLTNDKSESLDFTVATKITAVSDGVITSQVKTVKKDGTADLHSFSFPEYREEMEYQVRPDGTVLKAGDQPKRSLFYVPSLPIPRRPVAVGDTWVMDHEWLSGGEGIPLRLSVVGILTGIVPCEKSHCAEMDVSGRVELVIPVLNPGTRFDSRVWGRVLFSLERGDVIWSEMRSREETRIGQEHTVIESCMLSEMTGVGLGDDKELQCEFSARAARGYR